MESSEKCAKSWDELADLKELRLQIGRAYEKALDTKDFSVCGGLRQRIRKILEGQESEIGKLRENMVSPELKKLKLKEQYESQVRVAWRSGLFGEEVGGESVNQDGLEKRGIGGEQLRAQPVIERGGQKYRMPMWKEIQKALRKNKEIIKEKSKQGFTKMLIVPFGYDLKTMAGKFKDKVKELDQAGRDKDDNDIPGKGIFGAGGEKVDFNKEDDNYPVWVWAGWDESQLRYYPKKYTKDDHGGLTKDDAIKINGAWQICFVEDMPVIPLEGKGIGGRKQIDKKGSCIKGQTETPRIKEFKEAMDNLEGEPGKKQMEDPTKYRHESGMTPEKYLWMQLTSLLSNEKPVLMDCENDEYRGTYLTECFNVSSLYVPLAYWFQGHRWIRLEGYDPGSQRVSFGVRGSVNIIK